MSSNTIEEVKAIEHQAEELERDYKEKKKKMEKDTQDTIANMHKEVDQEIESFRERETTTKDKKLQELTDKIEKEKEAEISQLNKVFSNKREELVDAVIEEVMRKYGNS